MAGFFDMPSYQCRIVQTIAFEGKPNYSKISLGPNSSLAWGTEAGQREILGQVDGHKLKVKFSTPDVRQLDGRFHERSTEFLVKDGIVHMALSGGRQGVMDKLSDFRLLNCPESLRGFHCDAGNEYLDVFTNHNSEVTEKNGFITVDCQELRRGGKYVFDPSKDFQCIKWATSLEKGEVKEWINFKGHMVPKRVETITDDFFGAKRTVICKVEYSDLASEGIGEVSWKDGAWVKDNIEKKIYRVVGKGLAVDEQATNLLNKAILMDRIKTFVGLFLTLLGALLVVRKLVMKGGRNRITERVTGETTH
jgi:hypothetical protein